MTGKLPVTASNPFNGKLGNLRDPFMQPRAAATEVAACGIGKQCLLIEEITLRGVVRSGGQAVALVVNGANQVYFLRENDTVRNGWVAHISEDSILFRMHSEGKGRGAMRDVVRKLTGGPDA